MISDHQWELTTNKKFYYKLVSEFEGKKRMKMNKTVPSSSKLVSRCAETELSKTHGRLKRKHEYMKKK